MRTNQIHLSTSLKPNLYNLWLSKMGKHKHEKKHKKEKKRKHRKSSSESSSSEEEWVEKEVSVPSTSTTQKEANKRDNWMSLPSSFLTESHLDKRRDREEQKRRDREKEKYNPSENVRELNPYWKHGGDGLPSFKKPQEDNEQVYKSHNRAQSKSSWRKTNEPAKETKEIERTEEPEVQLSEKEMNLLASKIVKAEIMGNTKLAQELKIKLEKARNATKPQQKPDEHIILTETDPRGQSRPLRRQNDYSEPSGSSKRKKKVETHQSGERVRYFPDDDQQTLQQMFENEKFSTVDDQNRDFVKLSSNIRKNDDFDDLFTDSIRRKESDSKTDARNKDKAIDQHRKLTSNMDNCRLCIQSDSMPKHLMISMGETVILTIPQHIPLTEGHCILSPVRHVSCSTLLDENEWSEMMDFRRSLCTMFATQNQDVIFFETARNLERYLHMSVECVPLPKEEGDLAPIYFKKAIDECEMEWAQNKKLVSLKNRDVRKAVPKGLPYFFVSFGMEEGFAHVIEDQKDFPPNFAQEIIGGMLDLHHSKWRKPKMDNFEAQSQRALEMSKMWTPYDCTK